MEVARVVAVTPLDAFRLRAYLPPLAGVGVYAPVGKPLMERGTFVIPLASTATWVELSAPFK